MTKQQLKSSAFFKGNMILNRGNNRWGNSQEQPVFREITYYFNKENQEIGHIAFEGTGIESIQIFDPPRIWAKEFLNELEITDGKLIDNP